VVAAKISRAFAAAIQIQGQLLLQVHAQGHSAGIRDGMMDFQAGGSGNWPSQPTGASQGLLNDNREGYATGDWPAVEIEGNGKPG